MSCSVETLSLPSHIYSPPGQRCNENSLNLISPTSPETKLLARFLVISFYWDLQAETIMSWEAFKVVSHTSKGPHYSLLTKHSPSMS